MTDFDKLQKQIKDLSEVTNEMIKNVRWLDNQGSEPEVVTIGWLRGDAAELEAQVERLTQNLRAAADEAEEIIDPTS